MSREFSSAREKVEGQQAKRRTDVTLQAVPVNEPAIQRERVSGRKGYRAWTVFNHHQALQCKVNEYLGYRCLKAVDSALLMLCTLSNHIAEIQAHPSNFASIHLILSHTCHTRMYSAVSQKTGGYGLYRPPKAGHARPESSCLPRPQQTLINC